MPDTGDTPDGTAVTTTGPLGTSSAAAANARASFPTWNQTFNHGTEGWFDSATEGPLGWCGEIHHVPGRHGDVSPSIGRGCATVAQGTCNEFWDAVWADLLGLDPLTLESGPYGLGASLSTEFPTAAS